MREGQIASRELFGGEQHHHDLFVTAIYQWDFNKNARAMECAYIVGYTFACQSDHILSERSFPASAGSGRARRASRDLRSLQIHAQIHVGDRR